MTQGFYDSKLFGCVVLCLHSTSMNRYDIYEVYKTSIRLLGDIDARSMVLKRATFLMPFDHYPSLEELQQLPELFI